MKRAILAAILLLTSLVVAVPADPALHQFDQGDGDKVTIYLHGDETVSWATTTDGFTMLKNSKGQFEYAQADMKGDLILSGIKANDLDKRTVSETAFLNSLEKNLRFSKIQINILSQLNKQSYALNKGLLGDGKSKATKKVILLLAAFQDKPFTRSATDFNNLMNQVGYTADGATGSFKDFYFENSYGNLTFETTVAGPFTVSQNMAYYGANSGSSHMVNPKAMVTEVVQLANPTVDFTQFDNDNNGSVDAVYVIYAGYGEEAGGPTDAIWAHASSISTIYCDGKSVSKYSCSAELRGNSGTNLTRIGVICHEFGHVLGAKDYYDTDYATDGEYIGTGSWDLMAGGSWNNGGATPAHHNTYTKTAVYNWAPVTTLTEGVSLSLKNSVQNSGSFYRYYTPTANEYYLLENRQQIGFDAALPGHGMLIYHVDGDYISSHTYYNNINTTSHQGMYPMAANHTVANGISLSNVSPINTAGCSWPGSTGKTEFTDATIPSSKSWLGANTAKPLTSITENSSTKIINLNFMGGSVGTDAGITDISAPVSAVNLSAAETVTATIKNFGTTTITSGLSVCYKIDGGTPVTESYNGASIAAGASVTYTFAAKANLSAFGTHTVEVYTTLTGDIYTDNNSITVNITNVEPQSLPLSENFDSSNIPANWTQQNTGTGITPRWGISNTNNGGGTANELKASWQNINPATTRFVSPALKTSGCTQLSVNFKHFLDDYGIGATLKVQSSSDGINWTDEAWSLATASNSNVGPAVVNTVINYNLGNITYISWTTTGNLNQFDYWYIDDILIKQSQLAGSVTVGNGGTYANLTATDGLFSVINSSILTGNLTANIISDLTENGLTALNQWAESGAGNYTLTIQPNNSTLRTISGSAGVNSALIRLNGADRVTIDGQNDKLLTFINSNPTAGDGGAVISLDNSSDNCTVTNCNISNNNSASTAVTGVAIGNANGVKISKNKIYNLNGNTSALITGIKYNGTASALTSTIANNMISLIPTTTGIVSGISYAGNVQNSLNLYYNSIYIGGTQSGSANSYGFLKISDAANFNIKNNIFHNARTNSTGSGKHYAVALANTVGTIAEDYNLLYSANINTGLYGSIDKATLANWISDTPYDDNSKSSVILFENETVGNLAFKRVAANSAVYNTGVAVSGITEDFFGKARPQYGREDMGAHELEQSSGLEENILPTETILAQNYPNPFNPITAIHYELRIADKVKLTIFNAKGELVKTLVNGMQNAGRYSVNFDGAGFNSGVYFYKLEADGKSMVKRMLMVK